MLTYVGTFRTSSSVSWYSNFSPSTRTVLGWQPSLTSVYARGYPQSKGQRSVYLTCWVIGSHHCMACDCTDSSDEHFDTECRKYGLYAYIGTSFHSSCIHNTYGVPSYHISSMCNLFHYSFISLFVHFIYSYFTYACVRVWWIYAWMIVCMYVCMHACMHACMPACVNICMNELCNICMYACTHASMYACLSVSLSVYQYVSLLVIVLVCPQVST